MDGETTTPSLSIIVPFHNSAAKCGALLETLGKLERSDDVELIFVDDGSTDDTPELLKDFAGASALDVQIVERGHGGPGAARNSGLDRASGRFVWFVDSDDDIDAGAIAFARAEALPDVDLIAWEFSHPSIRRPLAAGLHKRSSCPAPTDVFDPIVANWFSMDFLKRTGLRFPENCIFEATPIEAFVLPLLVSTYFKSDFTAYRANTDCPSVTRTGGRFDPRFYDRLQTLSLGMAYVYSAGVEADRRPDFDAAFVRLFLWYSIRLSKLPGRSWLLAARVMRKYRDESRRFGIRGDPFAHYPGGRASRTVLRTLWALSAELPPQDAYFERLHMRAWGRKISWNPPVPPAAGGGGSCREAQARP